MELQDKDLEAFYILQELTYFYAYPQAFKAALDLQIPDILHAAAGEPLTPHQIADRLPRKSHDAPQKLDRILRLLAHKGIFSQTPASPSQSARYGLTEASKYLVSGSKFDLTPYVRITQRQVIQGSLAHLREVVEDDANGFQLANGSDFWSYGSVNPDFNQAFNAAMRSRSKLLNSVIAKEYEGFKDQVQCLVDVGGGVGGALNEIVDAHPHIRGRNFDLPHVIATAPPIAGVEHVPGSFLEFVPSGDTILLQQVLHDWGDEESIQILKNCHKALPQNGKVLIRDHVIELSQKSHTKTSAALNCDILMMASFHGRGKERTASDWKHLLEVAGFSHISFLNLQGLDLIEAVKV